MKTIIHIIIISLLSHSLFAQTGTVRGRIFNPINNEAIPFANVIIVGTNNGASSDIDGNFVITGITPGFIQLTATSVGYEQYFSEEVQVTPTRFSYVEIPLKPTSIQLETVEVLAPTFRKKQESPTSMRSISVAEIEKNPGGNRDISKIIQTLPGVGSTVSYRNDLIVRGGGPNENRFYLDNIEIPNLNHFATQGASGGPVSIVNADFLREVDFYSGSFPASKGNALSSVLDMKMLEGNKDKMAKKLTLGASDFGLTLDGPTGKKTSLIFSVRRSYLQLLFEAIGLPFLPTYNDFQLKQKINIDNNNQITIIGIGALDQSRLNLAKNETEEQRYILDYLPETDQWNYTFGISYQHFTKTHFDTYVISRNMLRNKSFKYLENDKNLGFVQNYASDETENKVRYERTYIREKTKITYGIGAEYAKYINSTYQRIFLNETSSFIDYNSFLELYKGQAFLQYSGSLNLLEYTAGLRTDYNSYSSSMSNPLKQLSPRIGFSYPLSDKLKLNTGSGLFYQLPAYTTLGYRNQEGTLLNKYNDLRYIKSTQASAGFEYLYSGATQFVAEGFFKNYDKYPFSVRDSISIANKGGDFGVIGDEEVISIGQGRAYGLELLARFKVCGSCGIIASYTFVFSEFKNASGQYIPTAWDQRHLFNFLITRVLPKNWTVGAKWRYAGGAPYTPYNEALSANVQAWDAQGRGYLDYNRFNSERLPAAHQLDFRIDKEYYWKKMSLNFYLDVQNAYNFKAVGPDFLARTTDENSKPIVANPSAPAAEQVYVLKKIPNTAGTIIPSLGIIIEF